jgi:hypothetical protein
VANTISDARFLLDTVGENTYITMGLSPANAMLPIKQANAKSNQAFNLFQSAAAFVYHFKEVEKLIDQD